MSSMFGKLFEYSLLSKLNLPQSDHQFGFTSGLSPVMAGLLVSEAKSEAIQNRHPLFLATLDSQKAFDTVHHKILLDKLFQTNIHKDILKKKLRKMSLRACNTRTVILHGI